MGEDEYWDEPTGRICTTTMAIEGAVAFAARWETEDNETVHLCRWCRGQSLAAEYG